MTRGAPAGAEHAAGGLEELYRRHVDDALRLAYLLTGDHALAEDLVQDAFVKVLGRFHDLRNRDAFWWYLRRTVVNLSNSHFRRRRIERTWLERQRPEAAAQTGSDLEERDRLLTALMTLRPMQRAAVVLRYLEDLSEADTADALGRPVGTVKSMVSRGMDRLPRSWVTMPDLDTRMPELLRRVAGGRQPDPALERRVLRRARRRRIVNASLATLAAVALVAGVAAGVRELTLSDHTTPGDESLGPSPATVTQTTYLPAVWPEVTTDALAAAQDRADAGEVPWRLDPVQTAAAFSTDVLGSDAADVKTTPAHGPDGPVRVVISNLGLGPTDGTATPGPPETILTLKQLGDRGDGGIWTVTHAETDRIDLDPIVLLPGSGPIWSGRLVEVSEEWQLGIWPVVDGHLIIEGLSEAVRRDGQHFEAQLSLPDELLPDGTGMIGVVIGLWDPEGTIAAAEAFPYEATGTVEASPTGATGPSGVTWPVEPPTEMPTAVLAPRDAIAVAAETHDFNALEALIDPDHFSYNFDDGSNPVPVWREDPAVLDTLAITQADVQAMLDAFGGYVGPRTGIAEDGTWLFYTIGGD